MAKIKLTKCDHDQVKNALADLKLDTDGSLKACVERLAGYYAEHEEQLEIAGCDVCGGDSDAQLDNCPFCGEAGVMDDGVPVGQEPPPPPPKKKASKKKAAPAPTKDETDSTADKGNDCVACGGSGVSSKNKPCSPCGGTGQKGGKAPTKKKAAPPTKKKATKKKAAPPTKKKATKKKTAKNAAPPTPAKVVGAAAHITVRELDEQIVIIRQQVTAGATALYAMGQAFKTIRDTGSWKTRMDPDKHGVPLHSNFKAFCQAELGMHFTHVFRAIAVAEEFQPEELDGLSGQQIRVVMQLPKGAARDEAMGAAKSGEAGSKLSDRAKALQGDKGKPAQPPAPKAVTVALTPGIEVVNIYKRPKKNAKVADTENSDPAMHALEDGDFFVLEMTNNVREIVRLKRKRNGQWTAAVERRRGEKT